MTDARLGATNGRTIFPAQGYQPSADVDSQTSVQIADGAEITVDILGGPGVADWPAGALGIFWFWAPLSPTGGPFGFLKGQGYQVDPGVVAVPNAPQLWHPFGEGVAPILGVLVDRTQRYWRLHWTNAGGPDPADFVWAKRRLQ